MCAEPRARVRRLNIFGRCSVQPRALVYVCLAYWEESEMHHYENIWPPPLPPVARAHISLTAPKILQAEGETPCVTQVHRLEQRHRLNRRPRVHEARAVRHAAKIAHVVRLPFGHPPSEDEDDKLHIGRA